MTCINEYPLVERPQVQSNHLKNPSTHEEKVVAKEDLVAVAEIGRGGLKEAGLMEAGRTIPDNYVIEEET